MFLVPFIIIAVCSYQEVMFERMLDDYSKPKEKIKEIPKGYYKCVDCGVVCERTSSSQTRCKDCQKIHKRELDKKRKKK